VASKEEAKELKEKCQSLSSKVDSLVKFLEEERAHRKRAESSLAAKEQEVKELHQSIMQIKKEID